MKKFFIFIFFIYVMGEASTITLTQQIFYSQRKRENKELAENNARANLKNLLLEDVINLLISKKEDSGTSLDQKERKFVQQTMKGVYVTQKKWDVNLLFLKAKVDVDMEAFEDLHPKPEDEKLETDPDAVLAKIRKYREKALNSQTKMRAEDLQDKYISSENKKQAVENFRQGRISQSLRQYKTAVYYFKKAIEFDPYYPNAYFNLGVAYSMIGDNLKAIKAYKAAVNNELKDAKAYYNMGIVYDNMNNYDKAIKSYQKAVEINPDYVQAYYNLASSYLANGKNKKSVEAYKKVLEYNPEFTEVYYNIGYVYDEMKEYKSAIENYKKAIELNPKYYSAIANLGYAYYNDEQYEQSILTYKLALTIHENDGEIYLKLGKSYEKMEEKDKMIESYQRAASLDNQAAKKYLKKEGISW